MEPQYFRQFIYRSFDLKLKILSLPKHQINYACIHQIIAEKENIPQECFYILINGKKCSNESFQLNESLHDSIWLDVCLSIAGGKGGFGSMLRAIGAQIEKTTNKEACRDLSGRRLRDVNAEKRFKEWAVRKAKEKMQKEKKRKDKLKELKTEPKIVFNDDQYFKDREEIPELVDDALECGLKVKKEDKPQNKEIILDTKNTKKIRKDLWLGVDIESDEDENTK